MFPLNKYFRTKCLSRYPLTLYVTICYTNTAL